jgi:hypothetical protein
MLWIVLPPLCLPCASTRLALAQDDAKARAREHFKNGVSAVEQGDFGEALEQFEVAYKETHAFAVLYNIGRVDVALGRAVEAVDAFEQYLRDGKDAIEKQRRRDVEAEIERQRARIGIVTVRTVPPGADVRVDGKLVGNGPVLDWRLTAGMHTIEGALPGFAVTVRELEIAGGSSAIIELKLEPAVPSAPATAPAAPPAAGPPPAAIPPAASPAPEAPVTPATTHPGASWSIAGYALGAAGLAATAIGVFVAVDSVGQASNAKDRMQGAATGADWDAARSDYDGAKGRNTAGWIAAGVGATAVAGGALLLVSAPRRKAAATDPAPSVAMRDGGLVASLSWTLE